MSYTYDDLTKTPQNTPATDDSPLHVLQMADEMLEMVKSRLSRDPDNQSDAPDGKHKPILTVVEKTEKAGYSLTSLTLPERLKSDDMLDDKHKEISVSDHKEVHISDEVIDTKESIIVADDKCKDSSSFSQHAEILVSEFKDLPISNEVDDMREHIVIANDNHKESQVTEKIPISEHKELPVSEKDKNIIATDDKLLLSVSEGKESSRSVKSADEIIEETLSKYIEHSEKVDHLTMTNTLKIQTQDCPSALNSKFIEVSHPVRLQKTNVEDTLVKEDQSPVSKPEKQRSNSQFSFDDPLSSPAVTASFKEIESSELFKRKTLPRDNSKEDDFYSRYLDSFKSSFEESTSESTFPVPTIDNVVKAGTSSDPESDLQRSLKSTQGVIPLTLANSWSEFTTPANIYSLSVSNNHIWFTDKSENIYYSVFGGTQNVLWRKATGSASQISVSPSSHIVWRLHKHTVYAGTKISSRHPEGLKWVEAIREVKWIGVDDNCAWLVLVLTLTFTVMII